MGRRDGAHQVNGLADSVEISSSEPTPGEGTLAVTGPSFFCVVPGSDSSSSSGDDDDDDGDGDARQPAAGWRTGASERHCDRHSSYTY